MYAKHYLPMSVLFYFMRSAHTKLVDNHTESFADGRGGVHGIVNVSAIINGIK